MPKAAAATRSAAAQQTKPVSNDIAAANGKNLDAMTRTNAALFEGVLEFNKEVAEFVHTRVMEDMLSAQTILNCRSGEDAFRAQADFFETAMKEYADGASRLFRIAADIAQKVVSPMEERTVDALHEMNGGGALSSKT